MIFDSPYHEQQLIQQLVTGSQAAFEQLFNTLYPRLVVFTEKFTGNRAEAEEIVNEAFTRFWLIRNRFNAVNKIKSFLYTSSRNAALNVLRKRKNEAIVEWKDQEPNSDDGFSEAERIRSEVAGLLFQEMEKLPEKYRTVLMLTYKEGLSSKQVAERLNITVSSVTTRRSRALQLLKVTLLQQYPALFPLCLTFLEHWNKGN